MSAEYPMPPTFTVADALDWMEAHTNGGAWECSSPFSGPLDKMRADLDKYQLLRSPAIFGHDDRGLHILFEMYTAHPLIHHRWQQRLDFFWADAQTAARWKKVTADYELERIERR